MLFGAMNISSVSAHCTHSLLQDSVHDSFTKQLNHPQNEKPARTYLKTLTQQDMAPSTGQVLDFGSICTNGFDVRILQQLLGN